MLPVYEAIDLIRVIPENVGHTEPWVILANTPNGLTSFVTKLFTTAQVDRSNCVTKEVVCNLIAREFELKVPDCALIEIPEEIVLRAPVTSQLRYDWADTRLKFGTVEIVNVNNAIPSLPKQYYQKRISLDTLYAFDNLIRNNDRGHPKPNLLIGPKDAFLIDHELALSEQDIVNIDLDKMLIEDRFTKFHLFYQYLKKTRGQKKQDLFNEFMEYLRLLNINKLNPVFTQLAHEGFNDYSGPICNWLSQVQQKSPIFVTKLKGSLQ